MTNVTRLPDRGKRAVATSISDDAVIGPFYLERMHGYSLSVRATGVAAWNWDFSNEGDGPTAGSYSFSYNGGAETGQIAWDASAEDVVAAFAEGGYTVEALGNTISGGWLIAFTDLPIDGADTLVVVDNSLNNGNTVVPADVSAAPTGVFKLQVSNNAWVDNVMLTTSPDVIWVDIPGSSESIAAGGEAMWNYYFTAYDAVRLVWTYGDAGYGVARTYFLAKD